MSDMQPTPAAAPNHGLDLAAKPEQAGIVIGDPAVRRAFESVLESFGLHVENLDSGSASADQLSNFEIVVADEAAARHLRAAVDEAQRAGEALKPAIVAIGARLVDEEDHPFDAFIAVPSMLSEITARLSVVLYAHRAFARRYRSALEELHLNRDIFRSVTNGISIANAQLPDMPLMYVNPSFELMTGFSLEEVQGKNCRFLQGEDREQPGLTLIREAIAQQRQTVAILRNYRKDGSAFWNELTLSPIRNHLGEVSHFVGIQSDVSDRVRVEGALRESEKLAAVGRLAATISHEINNPLEAVMNLVYLAKETLPKTPQNEEGLGYLASADDELKRVKQVAAQSLRFSKQSSNPEAVLINNTLTSVLDIYRARLRNYGVEVKLRLRSTQHVVVFESELRQVFSNLINNAMDAMKSTPHRTLTLRTREATDFKRGRSGVLVTISDRGTGIPKEVKDDIFKAFFSTKGVSGTGLGLWVTKGVIERHHGLVIVRSCIEPERSATTFQIFLPFQAVSGEDSPTTDQQE